MFKDYFKVHQKFSNAMSGVREAWENMNAAIDELQSKKRQFVDLINNDADAMAVYQASTQMQADKNKFNSALTDLIAKRDQFYVTHRVTIDDYEAE